jgi:hypothetical protein
MTRAIDRRLSRIEAMRSRGDEAARIVCVASDALAEQLHAEARDRGARPPMIIVTDASQSPPVIDGGTIDDMLKQVAEGSRRIHDPLSSGPIPSGRLWRPR